MGSNMEGVVWKHAWGALLEGSTRREKLGQVKLQGEACPGEVPVR